MKEVFNKKYENNSLKELSSVLFVVGYAVFLVSISLYSNIEIAKIEEAGITIVSRILHYSEYLGFFLCLLAAFGKMLERNIIVAFSLGAFFLGVEYLSSGNNTMLLYVFLFFGASLCNSKTIIKASCICQGILLFSTVGLSQLGFIEDCIFVDGGRNRHGLGFTWTTTGAVLFLHWSLQYIYLRGEKIKLIELLLLTALTVWFYKMTDASMTFYLSIAFIIYFSIIKIEWEKFILLRKRLFQKIAILFPLLAAFISILAQWIYDGSNKLWIKADSFTHGRLNLGHKGIFNYGITLLGQPMKWVGFSARNSAGEYNYIDCSYLQIAIEYGLLFLLLALLIYTVIIYRGIILKDYYIVSIICFLMVFAMTEPRLMNLMYTPFPLLVFSKMNDEKEEIFQKNYGIERYKSRIKGVSDK